ncbi:MAG TPA: damage-inducible protein DinB [Rhodobacteraceae bacterium]|nr:damage-inducible protein DinB [Paracoccaceae bacterium]
MITPEYIQIMARYNGWQNRSLYMAASGLSEAARQQDRGAFFGSIHGTLSHILFGDTIWMSRFDGWDAPENNIAKSTSLGGDWASLVTKRREADDRILDWAARVSEADLSGEISWFSGAVNREVCKPRVLLITHMFNHQTHHRGQVHAMLTAAGAKPDDTDLPFME